MFDIKFNEHRLQRAEKKTDLFELCLVINMHAIGLIKNRYFKLVCVRIVLYVFQIRSACMRCVISLIN